MTTTASKVTKFSVNNDGIWRLNTDDTWTLVPDFYGRITALQAAYANLDSGLWVIEPFSGQILNAKTGKVIGHPNYDGYLLVDVYFHRDGKATHRSVSAHRLVWQRVNGPIAEDLQINHLDGNKANNAIRNLEVVTGQENVRHALRIGLAGHTTRLTAEQVCQIRLVMAETGSYRKTALKTGTTIRQVTGVAKNTTYRGIR